MANINPLTGKTNEQVLAESTAAAKRAAEMIGGTFTQGVGLSLPSADQLKDNPSINISNVQADVPASVNNAVNNISTAASTTSTYLDSLQKQIETAQNEYKTKLDETLKEMGNLAENRNTLNLSDLKTSLYTQYGIPKEYEKITALAPEISALQEKINKIDTAEAQSIENLGNQPISEIVAQGREAAIKRQAAIERSGYASELAAKTALAEMYKGNIALAQSFVSDAVNTATYDIQQQNADLDRLYNYYGDFLSSLDKTTQNQLSSLRDELRIEEANQKEEKTNVLNLMIKYPSAGINVSDDITTASTKASNAALEEEGGGSEMTPDQKAIQYNLVKQRLVQVAQNGLTAKEYQDMRNELIEGGLGSYLDDFEKVSAQYLSYEDKAQVGIPTEKRFITPDYFRSLYTEEELKSQAKEEGFTAGGFLGFGVGEKGINDYLNSRMQQVEQYRLAGKTDTEILKLIMD